MRYLSVCSGIEAATQAWHPLGWDPVAFSEIEKFPSAVLAHHYPSVPNWGDMTKFEEWPDEPIDLLCGGTPCQSFSVAGLRQGLADPRGNLALTFLAIAKRYRPRWICWENVPGVYSANSHESPDSCPPDIDLDGPDAPEDGEEISVVDEYEADEDHAFACFLAGLQELGYGVAYRTLDAQHVRTHRFPFAVPQRRRRVWVVAYLGDWRRAAAVLFDRESLSGHPAPRRETGKGSACGIEFGPSRNGFTDVNPTLDTRCKDGPIRNQLAGAVLTANGVGTCGADDNQGQAGHLICANSGDAGYCLTASAQGSLDAETETLLTVAHSLRGEGFDASEDGTGRGTPIVPVAFDCKGTQVQFSTDGAAPTLRSMGHNHSHQNAGGHAAVAFDLRGREGGAMPEGPHETANMRAASGGSSRSYVAQPHAVRRLTSRECERLQGFPDDFTAIPWRGKPADQCPDGPRYKALGNSWAVNVADWVGERIQMVEKL